MNYIAELLKTTREESGIELSEVSKDLNIDEIILNNIEDGKIGAFKDIFVLKNYILNYAKYLGLDGDKIINEFNEYLFEYTSKIPISEIEKTIKEQEDSKEDIVSPYTFTNSKNKKKLYVIIYVLLILLAIFTIAWSINQITIEKRNDYIIGYRK